MKIKCFCLRDGTPIKMLEKEEIKDGWMKLCKENIDKYEFCIPVEECEKLIKELEDLK